LRRNMALAVSNLGALLPQKRGNEGGIILRGNFMLFNYCFSSVSMVAMRRASDPY
jgi:hypothetical protein